MKLFGLLLSTEPWFTEPKVSLDTLKTIEISESDKLNTSVELQNLITEIEFYEEKNKN